MNFFGRGNVGFGGVPNFGNAGNFGLPYSTGNVGFSGNVDNVGNFGGLRPGNGVPLYAGAGGIVG
jgi:hypothetical protein